MPSQVLSAAAILGGGFEAEDVRTVSGRSEEEVTIALEELVARGLITEREHGYEFGHERLRAQAEERVGRARRRLLHRRVAQALRARHGPPAVLARHLELAGDHQEAALAYAAAGDRARSLSARAEAIAHYESALALGHDDPATLHESIGDVHTLRGEYGLALAAYNAAAALAGGQGAARIEHKLGAVHERRGDWALAEHHYVQALGRSSGTERATVQADRSRVAWRRGEVDGARELGFEALALAEQGGAQAAAARAHNILGLLGCGREHLQRSLELSLGLADPSVRIAALNNLALDHAAAGELTAAEALTREALDLCIAQGDRHHEAALRNNLADVLHRAGRADGAMAELKLAATAFAAIGSEGDALYPGVWSLVEW
jgi:tetratricopeptide (TPR) repeat protein